MTEGEFLVIDPEQVQDGRMEIISVGPPGFGSPGPLITLSIGSAAFGTSTHHPRHKRAGVAPWVKGIRPNSVLQTTSVSSNRPRDLRSFNSPAIGLSVALAIGGSSLGMSAWLSQLPVGPPAPLQICTKRTPRSIIRRAMR